MFFFQNCWHTYRKTKNNQLAAVYFQPNGKKSVKLLCLKCKQFAKFPPRACAVRQEAKALNARFQAHFMWILSSTRSTLRLEASLSFSLLDILNNIIPTLWTQKKYFTQQRKDTKIGNQNDRVTEEGGKK